MIAIAKRENYTIVTDEVKNINLSDKNPSKNAKIPDVCEEFKIRCISMNQFFVEIGLSIWCWSSWIIVVWNLWHEYIRGRELLK